MFDSLFGLLSYDLGIDLGTANTRVFVRGKGVAIAEPSVIARHKKTKQVLSMGTVAKKMLGKTPVTIEVIRPVKAGVIADFDATQAILTAYIRQVHVGGGVVPKIPRPRVAVAVPSGITNVEKKALQDVVAAAGGRKVVFVDAPMAAAMGAGIPVEEASGILILDIGAGRTQMAIISLGGIVLSRSISVAGEAMDAGIIQYLRLKHSLLIGDQTAEELKIAIGSIPVDNKEGSGHTRQAVVRGRDLETGLPISIKISEDEVREAILPMTQEILAAVKDLIEQTPPELVSDVVSKGLILTGGGALLRGLDKLIAAELRLPVWVTDDPLTTVVRGCGKYWDGGGQLAYA